MSGIATIIIQPILIFIETDLIKFSNQQTRTIFRNLLIYFWIVIAKYVQTLLVTRIILIFANIRRAQQSDHNWKSIIDPNYKNQTNEYQEPSWIIKYFYIVGNPTYLLCIFTIYWLFEIICGLFVIFFNQGSFITFLDRFLMFFIVAAITGDLQLCIGGYFVYNIRKSLSYDNLYIWKELKLLFTFINIDLTVTVIGLVIVIVFVDGLEFHAWRQEHIIALLPSSVFFIYSWYLSTVWVNKQNRNTKRNKNKNKDRDSEINRDVPYLARILANTDS